MDPFEIFQVANDAANAHQNLFVAVSVAAFLFLFTETRMVIVAGYFRNSESRWADGALYAMLLVLLAGVVANDAWGGTLTLSLDILLGELVWLGLFRYDPADKIDEKLKQTRNRDGE